MLALAPASIVEVHGAATDTASACPAAPVGVLPVPVFMAVEDRTESRGMETVQDRSNEEMLERIRVNRDRAQYLRAERRRVQGLNAEVTALSTEENMGIDVDQLAPLCVICQDGMTSVQRRTVLECGHVFHEHCVLKYAECKQIDLKEACPMRCHISSAALDVHLTDDEQEAEGSFSNPQPIADDFRLLAQGVLQSAASVE